ncbi:MAG: ATP-binding protein [Oscillospiraceae bacterium]|nr:ATP-binding protein [Oscillospiraceae bacterium]
MAYSEAVLRRARAQLAQAQQERQETFETHLQEAYSRYPRLKEIDRALRQTMAATVAATFRAGTDPKEAVEKIKDQNLALQAERDWILEASDLDEDFLDSSPVCSICGGTGYVGSTMCECLRELCRIEQKNELSSLLGSGKERFSAFRLDYYSDAADPQRGVSPRRLMEETLHRCRKYAQDFSQDSGSLLFSGKTGLGKTFLSGCIARSVADRGFSVVYETAITMLGDFEAAKFGDFSEARIAKTQRYFASDLLIVDDLGTELVTQFTLSALYNVINTRLINGKQTIISTNLTTDGMKNRYTPQIASRLLGDYELIPFFGDDVRLRGKL